MKLALIGYDIQEKYNNGTVRDEDSDLFNFLIARGMHLHRRVWNDPTVDWTEYGGVVLKSPWDYHENYAAFFNWLSNVSDLGVKIFNSAETVRWNSDKHYLQDVQKSGLPTIPTLYIEKNTEPSDQYFRKLGTSKLVVKPCISAGAKNTVMVTPEELPELLPLLRSWTQEEAYMVQPFVPEILKGEWSLLFFGGKYSHSLLKIPKAHDFRVQHYLGGKVTYQDADDSLIAQAEQFVMKFAADTLYARVDGVLIDGIFHLMELELIEPYLFLDNRPDRMENYYRALEEKMAS